MSLGERKGNRMKKKLEIKSLQDGMIFSKPVFIEDENLLVPENIPVRAKDLEKLSSWGVTSVETEGNLMSVSQGAKIKPVRQNPDQGDGGKNSAETEPEKKGAYFSYIEIIEGVEAFFTQIVNGQTVEAPVLDRISDRLFALIRDNRADVIRYILGGDVEGLVRAKSSVNTAILSCLMAVAFKLPNQKILQIITGALLHDIGMFRLPKQILEKRGGLSQGEEQAIQTHPIFAFNIVTKKLAYPDDIARIVSQHHERWDGTGYPRKLAGNAIDIGARIVSVADAFEAMVSQKSYRNSMIGYQAMKNLLSDNSRRFDPAVIKAFILIMGIYPIGSFVLLNNGAVARVLDVQGIAPLRPKIRILIDEFGKLAGPDDINDIELLNDKTLFVVRAIDFKELARKND
jgi:hypothetical protein